MAGRVQAAMQKASRLTKQGNPSAALAIYDQLVLSLPKNQRVRAARAQLIARCEAPTAAQMQALAALNEAGDWGGLLQLCHRLAQTCPASEAVWTYRGAAALQLRDAAVAVHAFARAVEEFAAVGHTLGIEGEAVPPFPFFGDGGPSGVAKAAFGTLCGQLGGCAAACCCGCEGKSQDRVFFLELLCPCHDASAQWLD